MSAPTTPSPSRGPRGHAGTSGLTVAAAAMTTIAVVVAVLLLVQVLKARGDRVEAGSTAPLESTPYGQQVEVDLPDVPFVVDVVVAEPVAELGGELRATDVDGEPIAGVETDDEVPLTAPSGGVLVPVAWSVRLAEPLIDRSGITTVELTLVAGAERVALTRILPDPVSGLLVTPELDAVAAALDEDVSLEDVRVEVVYDGVTQSVDVATGEVDAG